MGYTSLTKVAWIVELQKAGQSDSDIAHQVGVDCTTVPHIFAHWEESGDFYYQRPKTGRPQKLTPHDICYGAHMLTTTEVANATELERAFPGVSRQTVSRELKEHGLICRVHRSRPYISPANQIKWYAWAKQCQNWTLGMWKWIILLDESKFLLFKSDGRQYTWFKPGQALDPRFVQKTIKHGAGNIMVWGCVTGQGMGRLHRIDGIMCSMDYVEILKKSYLGTLKDYNLKHSRPEGVFSSRITIQNTHPRLPRTFLPKEGSRFWTGHLLALI